MNKLALSAVALTFAVGLASDAFAAAGSVSRFYDPQTRTWVEIVPGAGMHSTKNPVPRQVVAYEGPYTANTIVVNTAERRLYYVVGDGTAVKYGVGVGRDGFRWSGVHKITRKAEWPGWTPPAAMRKRRPELPAFMEGGISNPLGARAMYIGSTIYRIHGSNEPWSIGQAVSSGCIRMVNDDVIDLYDKVKVGTKVIVQN